MINTIMKIWGFLVILAFVGIMLYDGSLDIYGALAIGFFSIPMGYFILKPK